VLEIVCCHVWIVPDHNDVFAVLLGRALAVIETSSLYASAIDHYVFVMMDGIRRDCAQRNASVNDQVHSCFAGLGSVTLRIDDDFDVNATPLRVDQLAHDLRGCERIGSHADAHPG